MKARLLFVVSAVLLPAAVSAQAPASSPSSVPPAVTRAFQQAYPAATIAATKQERDKGRTLYRIEGTEKGRRRIVLADAQGSIVERAEQVDEKELPAPVLAAIRKHRRAIYVSGLKVTRGRDVEYRLTVRGSRRTAMVARPDGTVISFE